MRIGVEMLARVVKNLRDGIELQAKGKGFGEDGACKATSARKWNPLIKIIYKISETQFAFTFYGIGRC